MNVTDKGRCGPGSDSGSLGRVHRDTLGRDNVNEEFNFGDAKLALLEVDLELGVREKLQNATGMNDVVLGVDRVDEDVIQVNNNDGVQTFS